MKIIITSYLRYTSKLFATGGYVEYNVKHSLCSHSYHITCNNYPFNFVKTFSLTDIIKDISTI